MPPDAAALFGLTALGAGWLVVHVLLIVGATRSTKLPRVLRLFALVPPITLLAGWRAGHRLLTLSWIGLAIVYAALRMAAS